MAYNVFATELPEVLILEPEIFEDPRGFLFESFNAREFARVTGLNREFVQDNHSRSAAGVLRGLHYQVRRPQAKLVRVIQGEVFDVAVDLRRGSPRFGRWVGVRLSAENRRQLWVPEGFGHGFLVTGGPAEVLYKATEYWYPQHERSLLWSDPALGIEWPLSDPPQLAPKDAGASLVAEADLFD